MRANSSRFSGTGLPSAPWNCQQWASSLQREFVFFCFIRGSPYSFWEGVFPAGVVDPSRFVSPVLHLLLGLFLERSSRLRTGACRFPDLCLSDHVIAGSLWTTFWQSEDCRNEKYIKGTLVPSQDARSCFGDRHSGIRSCFLRG